MDAARREMEQATGAARDEAQRQYEEAKREFDELAASSEETARLMQETTDDATDDFFDSVASDDTGYTSVDGMNARNGDRL